jgi:hypothetical protein
MLGGLIIGVILDLPFLTRPNRARVGWGFLFTTGEYALTYPPSFLIPRKTLYSSHLANLNFRNGHLVSSNENKPYCETQLVVMIIF